MFKILLTLALTASAHAATPEEDCTMHAIRVERIGPTRNQGLSGLCYAYEGADLVSYHLGQPVSALALALSYFYASKYEKLSDLYEQGGETKVAIETAQNLGGFCLESELPSDEDRVDFSNNPHGRLHDALTSFDSFTGLGESELQIAQIVFPQLDQGTFAQIFQWNSKRDRMLYLERSSCKNPLIADLRFRHFAMDTEQEKINVLRRLNRELSNDNLVGIGFHSNSIYTEQDTDDAHAATIIGRRWNSSRQICEYQVRDSFGPQCAVYKAGIECELGRIWLDEQVLVESLTEIEYID